MSGAKETGRAKHREGRVALELARATMSSMTPLVESTVTLPNFAAGTAWPADGSDPPSPGILRDSTFSERYTIGTLLGEGGMGVVRSCADGRIGREVAMKSVQPGMGSAGPFVARFLREACVQGQLEHPSIVPVYDLGRSGEGTLYFTMKRVRGATLKRILRALRAGGPEDDPSGPPDVPVRGRDPSGPPDSGLVASELVARPWSRRKLLASFASACHAVHFANVRGVVHRDLKPSNIMLGDFGEVYVLDWGLAKVVGAADPLAPTGAPAIQSGTDPGARTHHGATLGTPGYMAPEQVRGEPVDARADVYSLGAILFELLALEPLHSGQSPQAAIESTLLGVERRPSVRAPYLDIPPELDAICSRATAAEPELRYSSVRELVDAVERYLDGDRDLVRRRELARDHARAAEVHASRALGAPDSAAAARSRALHEVGRAIALDPTNEDAARILMRLMTELPAEMPAEAKAAMAEDTRRLVRAGGKMAVFANLTWFGWLPLMLWMGMRSWTAWLVASAAYVAAAAFAARVWRHPPEDGRPDMPTTVSTIVANAAGSTMFGPFVLVPTLAVIGAMLLHMVPGRAHRVPIIALNCLSIAVPALLALAGVIPASYVYEHGAFVLRPVMFAVPPLQTNVFMILTNVALVCIGSVVVGRFRDHMTRAEQRLHVQTWQLRQLVPRHVNLEVQRSARPADP
jgi:serine/threonine-protein kinase